MNVDNIKIAFKDAVSVTRMYPIQGKTQEWAFTLHKLSTTRATASPKTTLLRVSNGLRSVTVTVPSTHRHCSGLHQMQGATPSLGSGLWAEGQNHFLDQPYLQVVEAAALCSLRRKALLKEPETNKQTKLAVTAPAPWHGWHWQNGQQLGHLQEACD